MTKDDIIRMARDADSIDSEDVILTVYAAFAAHEREICAKSVYDSTDWAHEERDMVLKEAIAAAIRARGE